jgi:hypothetical protein
MDDEAPRREPAMEGVTGFELLGGAALPIEADLRIEITPSEPEEAAEALPPGMADPLLEQQDRLLAWLEESEENRIGFLADPVESIERAGIKLDPEMFATLRDAHAPAAATDAMPPGVELRSVRVDVSRDRDRPCRDDSEKTEEE